MRNLSIFWSMISVFGLILVGATAWSQEQTVIISTLPLEGFEKEDFLKHDFGLTIFWAKKPSFQNLRAYFSRVDTQCASEGYCYLQTVSRHKDTQNIPASIQSNVRDFKYLSSSALVNVDNPIVMKIANKIRATKASRRDQVRASVTEIQKLLIYPDDLGALPLRNTDEILSRPINGRYIAECKSYSNIFVAVARALGIPARIVDGYMLSEYGPLGHQWAEIKIDGTEWLPITAQSESGSIDSTYVPSSIQSESELSQQANPDEIIGFQKFSREQ